MRAVKIINKFLNKFSAELVRYPTVDMSNRMKLLKIYKINKILDVGANKGNYGLEIRKCRYQDEILSFEPINKVYKALLKNSKNDSKWNAYEYAMGDVDTEMEINIAGNVDSSSLLEMLPSHVESAPESSYVGKEKIKIHKLDTIFNTLCKKTDNVYLKIDTQGFEKNVLDGAKDSLKLIKGIQIEMSTMPLYDGQVLYQDLLKILNNNNFKLHSIENGFFNSKTGKLLQFDGIFFRDK